MSPEGTSAKNSSIAIAGDAAGPVVNVTAPLALSVAVNVEQHIARELPSFLGQVILVFSEQSLPKYGRSPRREIPPEVTVKLKHNWFPTDHRVIRDLLLYSAVLEKCYHGVEQRNSDARVLVRRKAGDVYDQEIEKALTNNAFPPISKLDYVRNNASLLVRNVINRLLEEYKVSADLKVEVEIADLAISLIVADAIVECEVLEEPPHASAS